MYSHAKINASRIAGKRIRHACRHLAAQYSPVPLPSNVLKRICTRRKLYNFLAALELSDGAIQSLFWSHNMPVPRDTKLRETAEAPPESRPDWLQNLNQPIQETNDDDLDDYNI